MSDKISSNLTTLKKRLDQKDHEIATLYQVSEAINSTLALEDLLKRFVGIVSQVTKGDSCLLYLFDDRREELILRSSKNPHPRLIGTIKIGRGEGITGWVAQEKRPVVIAKDASNDPRFKFFHNLPEDRYQAFLSVPIMAKNEVIGVINVQHKKVHRFSPGEIALVTTIAHLAGGSIENARLYEAMKEKAMQIETLSQVSKAIVSNRYLEEILHLIVTMTAEMMNSKICSIMLLDDEKKELVIKATQSLSEEYRSKPNLKIGQSTSGLAVKKKKPITVLDVTQEKGYMYPEMAKKEGLCSLLSIPMMIKDRVIGVINIYTSVHHKFTEEEIKIMQSVANQSAIAIESTKLFDKALAMEEELEARKMVERAKGILMRDNNISEEEAFKLIRKQSMNTRKSMREIADAIILAADFRRE